MEDLALVIRFLLLFQLHQFKMESNFSQINDSSPVVNRGSSKKKMIMIAIGIVAVLLVVAIVYFVVATLSGGDSEEDAYDQEANVFVDTSADSPAEEDAPPATEDEELVENDSLVVDEIDDADILTTGAVSPAEANAPPETESEGDGEEPDEIPEGSDASSPAEENAPPA